jgi:hypothetical protein
MEEKSEDSVRGPLHELDGLVDQLVLLRQVGGGVVDCLPWKLCWTLRADSNTERGRAPASRAAAPSVGIAANEHRDHARREG